MKTRGTKQIKISMWIFETSVESRKFCVFFWLVFLDSSRIFKLIPIATLYNSSPPSPLLWKFSISAKELIACQGIH